MAPTLNTLPSELILRIASSIDGYHRNTSLRALALTSSLLRAIAQEILICAPRFQIGYLPQYLEELWRPGREGFAHKVTSLEIFSKSQGRVPTNWREERTWDYPAMKWPAHMPFLQRQEFVDKCISSIKAGAVSLQRERSEWCSALIDDIIPALFAIVLSELPNLQALHLGASWLMDFPIFRSIFHPSFTQKPHRPIAWQHDWLSRLLPPLQSRLKVLEMPADFAGFDFMGWPRSVFSFTSFKHLTHLGLSMRALYFIEAHPRRAPANPKTVLPSSIQVLRISEATETTANFLTELCIAHMTGDFTSLTLVELFFEVSLNKTRWRSGRSSCPDPMIETRTMMVYAGLSLYIHFPVHTLRTSEIGATPWTCRDEGILEDVDTRGKYFVSGWSPKRSYELRLDGEGDVVMGGSRYE